MTSGPRRKVVHLTTVDLSLRYLLLAQLDASVAAGDEVVGVSAPGPEVEFLRSHGVRHVPLTASVRASNPVADLKAAGQLWRVLRRERPDVLHTHNPKPGVYGRVLGRLARVPLVVHTTHGLYATPESPWLRRAAVYATEAVAGRFSHVELVQNREDLEVMARLHLVPRRKLQWLGNGVDLARFNPTAVTSDERTVQRAAWGVADGEVVVGLVARLVVEKGIIELIEAVGRAGPPFRLVLVGPRDPEREGRALAGALAAAVAGGAVLAGHREDVERCYAAMDVFCLPSHREGFPRAAMEAAAMGLPVVATNIRGCRQVVEDRVNGLLVPVGDPGGLASALQRLALPEARAAMGAAGRVKACREFDEQDVVRRVLASYEPSR